MGRRGVGVRRTASTFVALVLLGLAIGATSLPIAIASGNCRLDPSTGQIKCVADGGETTPGTEPVPEKRFLHSTIRSGIGECHYWSNATGGYDSWDPVNDTAILALVLRTPTCPAVPAVDPEATAWSIFRSWSLAAPQPALQPDGVGITGLPSYLSTPTPSPITHSEVLPDARTLRVRADAVFLTVSWGDGISATYAPEDALAYPNGDVAHTYLLKTCTAEYRITHPSGGLCHPTLDRYGVTATFSWNGSYNVGSGWIDLGILTRTTSLPYEVNEARGVPVR
jgi:hypothetical protein